MEKIFPKLELAFLQQIICYQLSNIYLRKAPEVDNRRFSDH